MDKTIIAIVQGDITKRPVEVIVNAANRTLLGGGGVDGAIHKAAGPELLEECKTLKGCETGQVKATKAYGIRQSKYVNHAVGPIFGRDGNEANLLESCYLESLRLAVNKRCRTIAFPSISTGAFGYPIEIASGIALKTIGRYLDANPGCLDLVEIATFSIRDHRTYQRVYEKLFGNIERPAD